MSYILEALKKSDAERKRGEVPTLTDAPGDAAAPTPSGTGLNAKALIAGGAALVLVGGIAAWALMGDSPKPPAEQQAALQPPQPADQTETETETETEPALAPAPSEGPAPAPDEPKPALQTEPHVSAAPEPAPAPDSAPTPEAEPVAPSPVEPAPVAPAREVAVLKAQSAPPPQEHVDTPPIPEPVATPPAQASAPQSAPARPEPVTPQVTPLGSAQAHVDRAWESIDKGLFARAVADLDAATRLEPAYADAWFARGWANEKNGDEAQAIEDYARANAAKPDHAFALFSRGFLNLYVGNPRDAVVDFVRTQGVATDRSLKLYSHLWLYLSRTRAGQNAQARLKDDVGTQNLAAWPGPLVRHYMGAIDEASVLDAIANSPDDSRQEREVTGYFFLGALALEQGNRGHAQTYFEKALATGAVDFRQYDAAQRELNRLTP